MGMPSPERREAPRILINGKIAYRTSDSEEFLRGKIENLSTGGAFIWIEKELPAGSRLLLRVETEDEDETILQFEATVQHVLPDQQDSFFGYGCRIELA